MHPGLLRYSSLIAHKGSLTSASSSAVTDRGYSTTLEARGKPCTSGFPLNLIMLDNKPLSECYII